MNWKKIGKALLFPPLWLMLLLAVISAGLLTAVFIQGLDEHPVAYFVYVLSFYTLSVLTVYCCLVLPKQYRRIKARAHANPLADRYLTDRAFRTEISLHASLGVNLLYVALQLVQWYLFRSWWFVVLALYYGILSVMRFLLVRYVRKNTLGEDPAREWRRSRICAFILLLVNLSLSGAVLMILYQNRGYAYGGVLVYIMAAYTFYTTIHAIVDIIKYRKLGSPVMTTSKIITLCAALVSMLNLETAMFSQFGADMAPEEQRLMIILTGAGISITVIALSVYLIIKATKTTRSIPHGTNR